MGLPSSERSRVISFWPNPNDGTLHIGPGYDLAGIYDLRGSLLSSGLPQNNILDVSHLASGIYLVELTDMDGYHVSGLMVRNPD